MKFYELDIKNLNTDTYNEFFNLLTENRKEYILSFKDEKRRMLSVAAEMLVKKAVSELYAIPVSDVILEKNAMGMPEIQNKDIKISISHSEDMAVCALDNLPIGIDIEKIREINLKSAERFCNHAELDYIYRAENQKTSVFRFFEIWTAKEAEYKRNGGAIKEFKSVDTFSLKRKYFIKDEYLICISYTQNGEIYGKNS